MTTELKAHKKEPDQLEPLRRYGLDVHSENVMGADIEKNHHRARQGGLRSAWAPQDREVKPWMQTSGKITASALHISLLGGKRWSRQRPLRINPWTRVLFYEYKLQVNPRWYDQSMPARKQLHKQPRYGP